MSRAAIFNALGTAVAGSTSPAVDIIVRQAESIGSTAKASIPARRERLDTLSAALAIGAAIHVDDFDDTHLDTVIHPSCFALPTVLTVGETKRCSGEAALSAFALGSEAALRIGLAMTPSHYSVGWHITGTCGVMGATVTAALLLDLDALGLQRALGIAASQTVGTRAAFGTMTKSLHPGQAAQNGIFSAMLAREGFTAPEGILEVEGNFFSVLSEEHDVSIVTDGLGEIWHLNENTFKPYPCGIVCHPAIDASIRLYGDMNGADRTVSRSVEDIQKIVVHCHPLVADLTGVQHPADGMQARFSTIHGVVTGLMDGVVGLPQYSDQRVTEALTRRLREISILEINTDTARDEATVEVMFRDGSSLRRHVEHARGSKGDPLTSHDIYSKVDALVSPVLPGRTGRISDAVQGLSEAPDLHSLLAATSPL
jgi:2-methylcitrate dehydratase PrpD